MYVIIAGSREATYSQTMNGIIRCPFLFTEKLTNIISGMAPGADTHGYSWAKNNLGLEPLKFPAEWEKYKPLVKGKRNPAGAIRNREMLKHADALLAIWDMKSPGTKDMITISLQKGILVVVYDYINKKVIPNDLIWNYL